MTVPGLRCICHNEIYNKAPTSSYFSVSKTVIFLFQIKERIFIILYIVSYIFAPFLNNGVSLCF